MDENIISEGNDAPKAATPAAEPAQMSEVATLANVFIEPENTFKDMVRKPRWIIAGIIIALLVGVYTLGVSMKVGEAGVRSFITEQIDKGFGADRMTPEQKKDTVEMQVKINKYTQYAVPVFVFISFFIGGFLYWIGSKAFGGTGGFFQNLSVWIYSSLPPTVISMIANFIVLALKSADEIDLGASQRGLLHANPSFFLDGKAHPVIATVLSTFDIFAIWGWILAAIGLTTVNKISKGASWTLIIIIILIGLGFRLLGAVFSGNPS
jgi:hypothetical protein